MTKPKYTGKVTNASVEMIVCGKCGELFAKSYPTDRVCDKCLKKKVKKVLDKEK